MRIITRKEAAQRLGGISLRTLDRLCKQPGTGLKVVAMSPRRRGLLDESVVAYAKRNTTTA